MKQRANLVMDNKENANAREARPRKLEVTEALPLVIPKIIGFFFALLTAKWQIVF